MSSDFIGKKVFNEHYFHISSQKNLDENFVNLINKTIKKVEELGFFDFNVYKINPNEGTISYLKYKDFEKDPFPSLEKSLFINTKTDTHNQKTYSKTLNCPILHRKELLVAENHPKRKEWLKLTKEAENIGLFENTSNIGFKRNWLDLIHKKGYELIDTDFIPLGNAVNEKQIPDYFEPEGVNIKRHLTALERTNYSAPVQCLLKNNFIKKEWTFLTMDVEEDQI